MWSSVVAAVVAVSLCPGASPPVDGSVIAPFAPIGRYAGHWGVDFAAPIGAAVEAPASGDVSFAGPVAGRLSVSIDHGRGIVSTVSYLSDVLVSRGDRVVGGAVVGRSGSSHGADGVHMSVRIEGVYVDPAFLLSCDVGDITDALRLVPLAG